MALEGPGWRVGETSPLVSSGDDVSTYYEGTYHGQIPIDDKVIPPSMTIRAHRFRIVGSLFVGMKDAVEMIGEKLEEPVLEEAIAASGLREHIGSMKPEPGGSILNRELNAQFLTPSVELQPLRPKYPDGIPYEGPAYPIVSMGTRYVQARVSVYDFPAMLSYTMRNTALQHTINVSSLMAGPLVKDPRLALMESLQPELVAA